MKHITLTPNLNVADLPRSIAFYRDVVGLAVNTTVPDQPPFIFAWMKSGEVSVFLNDRRSAGAADPEVAKATPSAALSLYFVIEGLQEAFERVQRAGGRILKPPFEQFYGMREFICADPDGTIVIFAEHSK